MLEYLWATGELWTKKFDLVLAVELRLGKVQAASTLCELLTRRFAGLNMESDEILEMARYFRSHPSRLCIVLDGLDECSLEGCSEYITQMLLRKGSVDTHVVVTSRPCADAFKLTQCGAYHQQVEVMGFSAENVQTYVRKVVGGEKAEAMLEKLSSKPDILALMGTPMFAALTCEMFVNGLGLPESSTALYESLLLRVVERHAGKAYGSFSAVDTQTIELLKEVSHFALSMLVVQKAVFSEADVKTVYLSDVEHHLGLLLAYKDNGSIHIRQYRFAHLSIQEFLAAWYISHAAVKDEHDAAWLVRQVGHYSGHMATFWHFLIALSPPKASSLIMAHLWQLICAGHTSSLSSIADSRLMADIDNYSRQTPAKTELQRMQSMLCAQLTYPEMKELSDKLMESIYGEGNGYQRVESALPRGRELTDELFLVTLVKVWKKETAEPNNGAFLEAVRHVNPVAASRCERMMRRSAKMSAPTPVEDCAAKVTTINTPVIRPSQSEEERRYLAQLLAAHYEHCLYQGASCDGHCSFFTQVFSGGVNLSKVRLSLLLSAPVGFCLHAHSCIDPEVINMSDCRTCKADLKPIADGLQHCKNVRKLDLSLNAWSDGDGLPSILLSLSGSLQDVDVRWNEVGSGGFVSTCRALCSCKKLTVARLSYLCGDDAVPVSCVIEVVESCPELLLLDLNGICFTFDAALLDRFERVVRDHPALRAVWVLGRQGDNHRLVSRLRKLVSDPRCSLDSIL
eukprot:scpid48423/ scgid23754/ NACHT, LRR and PYD domains-containing protein 12; Monarch-1; PYRIN-containing APAF1-like protein 7; Regulated by nitric oxide